MWIGLKEREKNMENRMRKREKEKVNNMRKSSSRVGEWMRHKVEIAATECATAFFCLFFLFLCCTCSLCEAGSCCYSSVTVKFMSSCGNGRSPHRYQD